ncbi:MULTISPECIES: HD domain-containing phosphohydrolase [unclassified Paenibacillus]|uniref:HD-GYP domain-containing protein n=1 Tax=unclassified Paenibacillus TaxID=185978 RepID=UPI001AE228FD|nr:MULTISPECIES: HD domain-containing phosphohydrolase [unclassified Paenibacillus]MBP1154266.1 HD-GYP domain-containing protein (c-di-GMP phosphodiesterase class II) [Paenibacillus sp. PvP091]MBP1170349.1 HD-GYP domain-containing protein (c-di-GMP phosphodiesterase class II) [Paenibacillus sp. PvR098]MBP2441377.1 HD-GYP domain-containing protein (c-di-GMP phosphodiesterase class II) [Paenibacillus sp. PvP052]
MNTNGLWSQNQTWLLIVMAMAAVAAILLYWANKIKLKKLESQFALVKDMYKTVHPDKGLEENLDRLLELVSYIVDAPTYTFYIMDNKKQNYVLKAVRYLSRDYGNIRPSYSGLLEFQSDAYMHPLSLPVSKRVYEVKKVVEGDIPLLFIPVGDKGLILIGPLENINKKASLQLEVLSEQMSHLLDGLITVEHTRSQAQVVVASGRALQQISNISMDWKMMMDMLIKLCIRSINASGGFFFQKVNDTYQMMMQVGLDKETIEELNEDKETLEIIHSYVNCDPFYFIKRNEESYYQLPPYFAGAGMETLAIIRLEAMGDSVFVLYFEEGKHMREQETRMILNTMLDHVQTVMGYQSGLQMFSQAYLDILKMLTRLLDNLNPYTVGYSELMSLYSVSIARQLQLEEDEIKDIALAAYLSNIGVLGLSSELFEKEGKYTDEEYELMKLHAEVGASIVNVATGNERLAAYIMHHHERIDGNGYPSGLKEEEIPIGSRIIAVVQTFLAKVGGRKYREALSLNQALEALESAAGAQLDEKIVQVFIQWLNKKRLSPSVAGRPMGTCSELLCVPSSICQACPVYYKRDVPCWEVENNLCRAHGKSCETCIVRTEYMTRHELREIGV